MLQSVSWPTFFLVIAFILTGYYMVIGYLYYRSDLLAVLRQLTRPGKPGLVEGAGPGIRMDQQGEHAALMDHFTDELKALTMAWGQGCNKNEIMFGLGKLLRKFPHLKDSSLEEQVNTLIITECRKNCSVTIDQTETKVLWNG